MPTPTKARLVLTVAAVSLMGAGMAPGGSKYNNYWTQDFVGNPVSPPAMATLTR
jgi:hypothetical protein